MRCLSPLTTHYSPLTVSFSLLGLQPPLANAVGKHVEHLAAVLPADAAVGDAHAIDQFLAGNQVLPAGLEMAFEHDPEDARVAAARPFDSSPGGTAPQLTSRL